MAGASPGMNEKGALSRTKRGAVIFAAAPTVLAPAVPAAIIALGPLPLAQLNEVSTTVVDRNGKLLRAYAMDDGRWRLPVKGSQVDPTYLKLLFTFEDKR